MLRSFFFISFALLFVSATVENTSSREVDFVQVFPESNDVSWKCINSATIYSEKWNDLPQVDFWLKIMEMNDKEALLNVASTREVIRTIKLDHWRILSEEQKNQFRDSVRSNHGLSSDAKIYLTSGKNHFYKVKPIIPNISRAISIFREEGVDPFYAQSILLVESPNCTQYSNVGAYGAFQLMKGVARDLGLQVSKELDERKDFKKSAVAAAKLLRTICIPYTNKILDEKNIAYNQDDLWYQLLVLHVYHAGYGNVKAAIDHINPKRGGQELIQVLWKTNVGNFRNASQNYSQLILASLVRLDKVIFEDYDFAYTCEKL